MYRTILCAAAIFVAPAKADETLKFRQVQHSTAFQTQAVGDVDRHNVGVDREVGIVFFPDGSTGTITIIGTFDASFPSGGTTSGYHMLRFADGSELWFKYTGTSNLGDPKVPQKGTAIVIGGKGRYAGATGDGTWEGAATQPGAEGISYIDNVINIKK